MDNKLKPGDVIDICICEQGSPELSTDSAVVRKSEKGFVIVDIDMRSKRCEVNLTFTNNSECPCISIKANEQSLYLNKATGDTVISLSLPGWSVWHADIARYTLSVCLTRDETGHKERLK